MMASTTEIAKTTNSVLVKSKPVEGRKVAARRIFLEKTAPEIEKETGGIIHRKLLYELEGGKKDFFSLNIKKFAALLGALNWTFTDFEKETGLHIPKTFGVTGEANDPMRRDRSLDLLIYDLNAHWPLRDEDLIKTADILLKVPFREVMKHAKGWPIHIMYAAASIGMEPDIKQGMFVLFVEQPKEEPLDWYGLYFIERDGKVLPRSLITHPIESTGEYSFAAKSSNEVVEVPRNKVLGSAIPWR